MIKSIFSQIFPAALWLLSFLCALYWVDVYPLEIFTAAVFLLFGWSYTLLSRKLEAGWMVPRSPVLMIAGAFWILVFASTLWSEVKPVSFLGLAVFSLLPLTFFTGVLGGDEKLYKKIAYALAVLFGSLAAWAVFQFFFLNMYMMGQARHPLADPASLGALFSLAFFCAAGWMMIKGRSKAEHNAALVLCILLACGLMATVSRGPILALIPGIIALVFFTWQRVKANKKRLLILTLAVAAFFGAMQSGVEKKFDLTSRFSDQKEQGVEPSGNRVTLWQGTWDMIKDRPWLGTGIGTYFLYYPEYKLRENPDNNDMAHNDPLQFWAELGIAGPVLFYAFGVAVFMRTRRAIKIFKEQGRDNEGVVVAALFAGLLSMAAHAHVSFNHYNPSILMLSGLMLAVWFGVSGRALNDPQTQACMPANLSKGVGRIILAVPYLMMGWLLFGIVAGEHLINRAGGHLMKAELYKFTPALFDKSIAAFADDINAAGKVSGGMAWRTYLLAVNVPMSILQSKEQTFDKAAQKELYGQVEGYMKDALIINPRAAPAYYYLAKVQSLVDADIIPKDTPTPEEYYKKVLTLDQMHLGARMALDAIHEKAGQSARERLAFLEEGLGFTYIDPAAENYLGLVAKLYLEVGNYVKMKDTLGKLAEFKRRSAYSFVKRGISLPQAIMGGDRRLPQP